MRRTFVVRDGQVVERGWSSPPKKKGMGANLVNGAGDGRGFSFQLPRYYKHANRFIEHGPAKGRPCWTSKQEASEIAARASDAGEDIVWDKGGGLQED